MAAQSRQYQLFPFRPSAAQTSIDALASALWRRIFPQQYCGPTYWLDQIFASMYQWPELVNLKLCPYYFDQVTYSLPTRKKVKPWERCNLRLHCFDSWADENQARQWVMMQRGGRHRHPSARQDVRPNTAIPLSRLCQLQDVNTGRSLSMQEYIYLMYGYLC